MWVRFLLALFVPALTPSFDVFVPAVEIIRILGNPALLGAALTFALALGPGAGTLTFPCSPVWPIVSTADLASLNQGLPPCIYWRQSL